MVSIDEQILRATKEIVVKFIEAGRISPAGFHETFKSIYHTVQTTVKGPKETPDKEEEERRKGCVITRFNKRSSIQRLT